MAEINPPPIVGGTPVKSVRTPNDALIAHADRLWNSAVQNATRIASRVQIVGGGILVMIGVEFSIVIAIDKTFDWPRNPTWIFGMGIAVYMAIRVMVLASLYYFARAISRLYIHNGESKGMAAAIMEFRSADVSQPIKLMIFRKTYRAYLLLNERNEAEKERLRQAQSWFAKGLALMGAVAIVYMMFGVVPKLLPRGDSNGGNSAGTAGALQLPRSPTGSNR